MDKCFEIREAIDSFLKNETNLDELSGFREHIDSCTECKISFDNAMGMNYLFNKINDSDDIFPESDRLNLHTRLVQAAETKKNTHSFLSTLFSPFKIAAITFFAAVIVVLFFIINIDEDAGLHGTMISETEMDAGESITVRLKYNAAEEIKDAVFTIELDKELAFDSSYEKVRALKKHSWKGSLKKGENDIPFMVKVKKPGEWIIHTTADYEGYRHLHKIVLKSKKGKVKITYFLLGKKRLENIS